MAWNAQNSKQLTMCRVSAVRWLCASVHNTTVTEILKMINEMINDIILLPFHFIPFRPLADIVACEAYAKVVCPFKKSSIAECDSFPLSHNHSRTLFCWNPAAADGFKALYSRDVAQSKPTAASGKMSNVTFCFTFNLISTARWS